MEKKTFEKVDENIFYEKLNNGVDVYLYPTNKTKNFYITISVKYGANVSKYKVGNRTVNIIPGSAHFLEHKVMALSENKEISKRINELGSLANAWTSYYGTNYNIYGSINLIENLKLLLDIFYKTDINPKNVDEEKGIIGEEIDMYKDSIDSLLTNHLYDNLFNKSYVKHTIVGERTDLEKITAKSLNEIYNDYYIPNNTFIVVTGNFDENEVLNVIKEYMDKLNLKQKKLPERIKENDSLKVFIPYEEITKDLQNQRVKIAFKMNKKIFNMKDDILKDYIGLILSSNLGTTSKLFEKYKLNNIIIGMNSGLTIIDDYLIVTVDAITDNPDLFIKNIKKDIKKLKINKTEFERKKKNYLKSYIMDFDNIVDVEYMISVSLMINNYLDYDEYSLLKNMDYNIVIDLINKFNFDNECIIKTVK